MNVKFCGITRADDALCAAELGAWAVGFIFHEPSPRYITPDTAREIGAALPAGVLRVGVMVDLPPARAGEIARTSGIDIIQLHGDEDAAEYAGLGLPIIKAIRTGGETAGEDDVAAIGSEAALLVDGISPGSGRLADWARARLLAATRRVVLSGGLTPDNVAEAIAAVRPMGVDVSSGVESAPGIKDHALMRQFMEAAARRRVVA